MEISSDREEIRWQFQLLLDLIHQNIESLRRNRDHIIFEFQHSDKKLSEFRNFVTGILGFVATLLVSLVAINYLTDPKVPYIEYAIAFAILGFITYFSINWFVLYRRSIRYQTIDSKYDKILSNHNQIRAMISNLGSNLTVTHDFMLGLKDLLMALNDAMMYDLSYNYHKILKHAKPNQEIYRVSYQSAKSLHKELKKYNFPLGLEILEKFVNDFESNEKEMQN